MTGFIHIIKKKILIAVLCAAVCLPAASGLCADASAAGTKKARLPDYVEVTAGAKKKVAAKGTKKTVTWKVIKGKKYIRLSKKKNQSVVITGKKKGMAVLAAKAGKKTVTCRVYVRAKCAWRLEELRDKRFVNFRTSDDALIQGRIPAAGIDLSGMDTLHISGSAQPSLLSLPVMYQTLKEHAPSGARIYLIDLRQETHAYVNGYGISRYAVTANDANAGLSAGEVRKKEAAELAALAGKKRRLRVFGSSDQAVMSDVAVTAKQIITEREAAQAVGFSCRRFTCTDKVWPNEEAIDQFVAFCRTLPENAWLHFHCKAGQGRTTTFMVMYDMMNNPDVAFSDIIARQYAQGGIDLTYVPETGTVFNINRHKLRAKNIRLFYRYVQEQAPKDYEQTWSVWYQKNA